MALDNGSFLGGQRRAKPKHKTVFVDTILTGRLCAAKRKQKTEPKLSSLKKRAHYKTFSIQHSTLRKTPKASPLPDERRNICYKMFNY